MIGVLFKKQLREQFAFLYRNRNGKKQRSRTGAIVLACVLAFSYLMLAVSFYFIAWSLAVQMSMTGTPEWIYFSILASMSLGVGLFGSVFITYNTIYKAKDNELLLSMPIPPWKILLSRILMLFVSTLVFTGLIMVPALIAYFVAFPFKWTVLVNGIVLLIATSLFILSLSAVLAYFIALIAGHVKHKQIAILIVTLAFLGGYYYLYFRLHDILETILMYSTEIGRSIRAYAYPVYAVGEGYAGNVWFMLAVTAVSAAIFSLVYFILSKTFIRLATKSEDLAGARKKTIEYKTNSVRKVLLKKEFRHLTSSANYMLNAAFGTLILLVGAVMIIIKGNELKSVLGAFYVGPLCLGDLMMPLLALAISLISSTVTYTASSISIEGKSLWILRTMPLSGKTVLQAKRTVHLLLTLIPSAVAFTAGAIMFRPGIIEVLVSAAFVFVMVELSANFDMFLGIKSPILDWDNEAIPVKTGLAVGLSTLLGFLFFPLLGGILILLAILFRFIGVPSICAPLVIIVLFAPVAFLLRRWIMMRGVKQFESL